MFPSFLLNGAESKDPENDSGMNAASRRSLEKFPDRFRASGLRPEGSLLAGSVLPPRQLWP
jgi:hypothetical protein